MKANEQDNKHSVWVPWFEKESNINKIIRCHIIGCLITKMSIFYMLSWQLLKILWANYKIFCEGTAQHLKFKTNPGIKKHDYNKKI